MVGLYLLFIVRDVIYYKRDKCVFFLCGRLINIFLCDFVYYYVSNEIFVWCDNCGIIFGYKVGVNKYNWYFGN